MHHGIWDFDIPCAPILVDITVNGRTVKAVAQPTKQAFLYVFDRVTGEPVWPIEERPVPKGDVPGEWYSPTQPFPTKPPAYDRQGVVDDDLIDFTPELRAEALKIVARYKMGPIFTPPVVSKLEGPLGTLMAPSAGRRHELAGRLVRSRDAACSTSSSGSTVVSKAVVPPIPARSDMAYIAGQRRRPARARPAARAPRPAAGAASSAGRAPRADARRAVARAAEGGGADRAGAAAREAAVRPHHARSILTTRRDPLADRARRDAGQHQEPSGAERT